jgi:tetratricopeptide (TPR) repeat protein
MKTRYILHLLLALASSFVMSQEVRKADTARPAAPGEVFEEVQKPVPFTDTELRVLRSASSLSTERLLELLVVYEKVENTAMMDALARAILRREPNHPDASRIQGLVDPEMETRHFGYLDEISKQVMAGKKVEDTDSVAVQAGALANEGNPGLAVQLLEALRRNQYANKPFPYLDDLAFAYNEAGMLDQAIKASEAILTESGFSAESRIEAQKLLPSLRMRKRIAGISREAGSDMDLLVSLAEKLYREKPADYDVIAFRIESLDRARRYDDAVIFLEGLKKKATKGKVWPYQITLAFAYFGARRHEDAIAAFRELQKTPGIDAATRAEAENMILEIRVGREIELGMAAMKRGDMAKADAVLRTLERDYKLHPDTLGYRAILLAKRGNSRRRMRFSRRGKQRPPKSGCPSVSRTPSPMFIWSRKITSLPSVPRARSWSTRFMMRK